MSKEELYQQRLERIRKAVRFEPVDKIPVAPCGNAYWARQQGVLVADYVKDFELACTTNIEAMEALGGVDATQSVIFCPYLPANDWLSEVAVPGDPGMDPNGVWQIMEAELMKPEDYQVILDKGFGAFYQDYCENRLNHHMTKLKPFFDYLPTAAKRMKEAGIPCICDFLMITPFEYFCGGRSLETFFTEDLMDEPELMDEVFAKTYEYKLAEYGAMMDATHPLGVWVGGWRSNPAMISPAIFDRFVWPHMKGYAELCLSKGVIPIFHLDANWDLQIQRFLELPAKSCIMALDSATDIRRARQILGDHMCILGDVPPQLLAFGKPEEVREYVYSLCRDIGPTGYIVASGCDIPTNAKPENVKAMCDAANSYLAEQAK